MKLGRYKKNKVAAADEFCVGWVRAVAICVPGATAEEDRDASLIAYMTKVCPSLGTLTPRRRELANIERASDHRFNGFLEGKKAHVNAGIGNAPGQQISIGMDGL